MANGLGLFLTEGEVAAALQLLRRLLQPNSNDVPHITLRYARIPLPADALGSYLSTQPSILRLDGPGTFDTEGRKNGGVSTLFVAASSIELEALSYKPDFPDSIFHLSIYDGARSFDALAMMDVMSRFPWRLQYSPAHSRVLEFEAFREVRNSINEAQGGLMPEAREIYSRITGAAPSRTGLTNLSSDERLDITYQLCDLVHKSSEVKRAKNHVPLSGSVRGAWLHAATEQPSLFSDVDLGLTQSHPMMMKPDQSATVITPPEVASQMMSLGLSVLDESALSHIRFLDPALGGGIFFAQLVSHLRSMDAAKIESAVGVERRFARAEQTRKNFFDYGLRVICQDFLTVKPSQVKHTDSSDTKLPNFLVANPPYMRPQLEQRNSAEEARRIIWSNLGLRVGQSANVYIYFVLMAHQLLERGAVATWLLPADILYTASARPLREYLASKVRLARIHVFDDVQRFENARISTMVITYVNETPRDDAVISLTTGGDLEVDPFGSSTNVSVSPLQLRGLKEWRIESLQHQPTSVFSGAAGPTIQEFFHVTRGMATGANNLFILSEEQVQALGITKQYIRPLLPWPRELTSASIEADEHGRPAGTPLRWLIDTASPMNVLDVTDPALARYLRSIEGLVMAGVLARRRRPFYKQEKQDPAPMLFVAMAHEAATGRRFVRNRSRGLALNNYHLLRPRPAFENWLKLHRLSIDEVHEALNQIPFAGLVARGRPYYKGAYKLEPGNLRAVELRSDIFTSAKIEMDGTQNLERG